MTVRSRNARGFRNPSSSSGVASPPPSIRGILPHGSQRPGAALVPALRRRSSTPGGAELRCRPRGIRMTENGRGTEPHRRIGLSERRPPGREGHGGRSSLSSQADQTKAPRLGSASGGEGEWRPAQAHTVSALASGCQAASPYCRPRPAPGRPLRLTVPSRAHELVQQGPHLRLGGHGGQWRRPRSSSQLNSNSRNSGSERWSCRPEARSALSRRGNAGRKFVNVVGGPAGKCSLEKPESLGGSVTNCPRG